MMKNSKYLIRRLFAFILNLYLLIPIILLSEFIAKISRFTLGRQFVEDMAVARDFTQIESLVLELASFSYVFLVFIFVFLLHFYLIKKYRVSIGKKVFDLEITTLKGSKPNLYQVVIKRNSLLIIATIVLLLLIIGNINIFGDYEWDFIFFLILFFDGLFIFRKDRRCLHDLIAGTKVVEKA